MDTKNKELKLTHKEIFGEVKMIHTYAPPNADNQDTKDIFIGMKVFIQNSENIDGLKIFDEIELLLDITPYDFLQTFNKEEYKNIKIQLKKQINKL